MRNLNNKNKQSGRSMIEMLGVLAIIGALSVGGIAGYTKAMRKSKINNIRNQVTHIVTGVKRLYASQKNYDGLTTEVAIKAGIIPNDMIVEDVADGSSPVKHIYNGDIWVEVDTESDEPNFVVLIDGLPKDATVDVATADWSQSDLLEIEVVNRD